MEACIRGFKGIPNGFQIIVHHLSAGHLHLFEDVIIAAGNQDSRLLDSQFLYQFEIFLFRPRIRLPL